MEEKERKVKVVISWANLLQEKLLSDYAVLCEQAFSLEDAESLLSEAEGCTYTVQPEYFGSRKVHQQVSSTLLKPDTPLSSFTLAVQEALVEVLGAQAFDTPLSFNDCNIQRYEDGSYGIDPHRDHKINRNLVVLCGLAGFGRFTVYEELGGPVKTQFTIVPGSIMVMIAPGFNGLELCPVHGVDQIKGRRYIVGMRECGHLL